MKEAWPFLKISLVKKVLRTIEVTAVEILKNFKLFIYVFLFGEARIRRRNILLSNSYHSCILLLAEGWTQEVYGFSRFYNEKRTSPPTKTQQW